MSPEPKNKGKPKPRAKGKPSAPVTPDQIRHEDLLVAHRKIAKKFSKPPPPRKDEIPLFLIFKIAADNRAEQLLTDVAVEGWSALDKFDCVAGVLADRIAAKDAAFFSRLGAILDSEPDKRIDRRRNLLLQNWEKISWFRFEEGTRMVSLRIRHKVGLSQCTDHAIGQFCAIGTGEAQTRASILRHQGYGAALVKWAKRRGLHTKGPALIRGFKLTSGWILPIWTKRGLKWRAKAFKNRWKKSKSDTASP
jgi:hypothetical protein